MSRIAKITTIVLVCGITLSAAAYFLRDTAVAGVVMQKVNTYRLNQGLVGWWTFDGQDVNWKTGRVSDRLGNNNYGTIENMSTSTSPVPGKVGQALQFDGVNDEVDSPNPFNGLDSSASATFTWSWWQKTNQDGNGHMIGWGSGRFCSMGFISGYVACTVDSDANGGVISLTTLADNQWHHVVYTHSPGSQTLYVDGVLNDTANETFVTGAGDIDVGVRPFGIYWQGALDDVRIYNRALSAQEVKLLYTSTAGSKMNTSKNVIPGSTLQSGLVGLWSFDGPDVTDKVYDRSGNGNNGYFTGGATNTAKVAGKVGQALQFDGVDDEVITKDIDATEGSSYLTVAAWIKQDVAESATKVITKWGGGGNWEVESVINSQSCTLPLSIRFQLDWGISGCVNNVHQTGVWEHWVFVFDGTQSGDANRIKAYVNGTQRTVDTFGSIPATTNSNADPVEIGTGWTGSLDDIRVYNRALSAAEVKDLYTATMGTKVNTSQNVVSGSTLQQGLVGLWSFNGLDTTDKIYDRSGQNNHGYFVGGATSSAKVPGKVGQALRFNGTNNFVQLGTDSIDVNTVTVCVWVNPGHAIPGGEYESIVSNGVFFLGLLGNSGNEVLLDSWSGGGVDISVPLPGGANDWNHVCGVRNSGTNGPGSLYINGTLATSGNTDTPSASGLGLYVGATAGSYYFNGTIDDVRIYNRALTPQEVKLLYNLGR